MSKFLLPICLLFTVLAHAQKPKFYSSIDAKTIVEGSYAEVSFTLENANGKEFQPPKFEGFKVVSGPSTSRSTSFMNGVKSSSFTISYGLQAKSIGKKTIGVATITVGNRTMKSDPMQINVVKGNNAPISQNEKYFVTVSITDSLAYVGQQLILDYKLFTIYDVRSIKFLTEADYDGFYKETLNTGKQGYQRVVVNGKEYYSKSIQKIALFPQQTGTYNIPAQSIEIGIATGRSGGFFFSSQLAKDRVTARALTIQVQETPPTAEQGTGAVGRYSMQTSLEKKTITTDEAITVYMQVVGNGDSKTVSAPEWDLPAGLEMYDPNVIEDETFKNENQISHRKTFEYLIVAKEPGVYNLKPTFSYFNTDSLKYIPLTSEINRVRVLKGSNSNVITAEKEVELATIKPLDGLRKNQNSYYHSPLHLGLLSMVFLSSIGIFVYGHKLEKSGKYDPLTIKRNKAYEVAKQRLEGARAYLDTDNSKAFHEEIIFSLKKYLTDKRDIPALHLKKTELISKLKDHNLSQQKIEDFQSLLDSSEIAMYAPGLGSARKDTYEAALNWIKDLEEA